MKVLLRKNASLTSGSSVKSSEMQLMNCGHLTVAELQVAKREIFKRVQQVALPEVIDVLSVHKEGFKEGRCINTLAKSTA